MDQSLATNLAEIDVALTARCAELGRELPTLIAVSKKQPVQKIIEAYGLGQRVFGENYVQELLAKDEALRAAGILDISFHFIGALQRNKVRALLGCPACVAIHSVDSLKLAETIGSEAVRAGRSISAFLQVNIDQESTKAGVSVEDLPDLSPKLRAIESIHWLGLMCIPSADGATAPSSAFSRMQALSGLYGEILGSGLSMGMSSDYLEALPFGATHIRLGTVLFGARSSVG